MRTLDHRLLRQFLAVSRSPSLREAARRLHISQPPLSTAIQTLEERLQVTLLERTHAGIALTPAGELLAAGAERVLGQLAALERDVVSLGRKTPLRIGFVSIALARVIPMVVSHLRDLDQPMPVLTEMTTPEQLAAMTKGDLDLGFFHPLAEIPDGYSRLPLSFDPFWAAVPTEHPLAQRDRVDLKELAGQPFVLFPEAQGPALYDRIRRRMLGFGKGFEVIAHLPRAQSQMSVVSSGLAVGLVAESTARALRVEGVRAVPIKDIGDLGVATEIAFRERILPLLPDALFQENLDADAQVKPGQRRRKDLS